MSEIIYGNSFKAEKMSSRANFGQNFAKNGQKRGIFCLDSWPQYMVLKQIWLILMIFSDLSLDLDNKNLPPQISASNGLQFFLEFYLSLGLECPKNWALISALNELKILTSYEPQSQPLKKLKTGWISIHSRHFFSIEPLSRYMTSEAVICQSQSRCQSRRKIFWGLSLDLSLEAKFLAMHMSSFNTFSPGSQQG